MKNRSIFILCIITVAVIASCKKYLKVEPDSMFSEAYVFSSVSDATKAVTGVYNRLAGDFGYGGRLNYYFSGDTDEILGTGSNSSGGGDNANKAIARYNATPSNTQLEPVYNQLYQGIERANNCLKNIPKMALYTNGTDAQQRELRRLHGEVLTLRAQFYFDLIKHWGDIPAQFIPSSDLPSLSLPKTDRDSIYDVLLADLLQAEDLVPWRGESGVVVDERITKGAVKGLRARLALHRGGYSLRRSGVMERRDDYAKFYEIARKECQDIMTSGRHKLNTSYEAVFRDNLDAHRIEPNGEVLFEVALAGGTGAADGKIGNIDGIRVNGKGQGSIYMIPTYFYSFDSMDVRRDVTIAAYAIDAAGNKIASVNTLGMGILLAKFRRDWISNPSVPATSDASYHGVNWPLIRYSDILLMFAEAENELNGPSTEAQAALKEVRKRGFNGDETKIGVIPSDKAGFFQSIVNERAFELGGEAVRKYDLIRWNIIHPTFVKMKADLALMRQSAAPFNNLPVRMFYKNQSPQLVWLGSYYKPATLTTAPAGYTAVNWTAGIPVTFVSSVAEMFKPNHSELLPLPQSAINSNTNLKQDYGY